MECSSPEGHVEASQGVLGEAEESPAVGVRPGPVTLPVKAFATDMCCLMSYEDLEQRQAAGLAGC